jgi:hypothetical protein
MPRSKFLPKKAKKYSDEDYENAKKDYENRQCSMRQAAFQHNIPFETFRNNLKNNIQIFGSGSTTILSYATEKMLVHMIQILGDWGYGLKFQDLQKIVGDYLIHTNQTHLFKNGRPGVDWYNHFKNRWSNEISSRIATNLTKNRAASCTPEIIEKYFETCQRVYSEAEIDSSKSSHVWNVDETGFSGNTGEETILVRKGSKRPIKLAINKEKIHYTGQNCCNAEAKLEFVSFRSISI